MSTLITLTALIVLMLLGMPVAWSLTLAGLGGIYLITGDLKVVMGVLEVEPFRAVAHYLLSTIPTFILMAYLSSSSGLARDLYEAAAKWLSGIRGGAAIATVFAAGIFGAMSGASTAAATVMSSVALPNMRRLGYSDVLATGAICLGATLDILIPPSVAMVIYGIATETSIGKLLIAGIIPGILLGALICVTIFVWVHLNPGIAPRTYAVSWRERWTSVARIWPSLGLVLAIIAMLYLGVATPTEVGAMGAFFAAVVGFAMRRLTWRQVLQALRSTALTSGMIFMIMVGATIFGYFMSMSQLPQQMSAFVISSGMSRWTVIAAICLVYFVLSMFMDEAPLMLITLPISFPLIMALGFDPVWFGIVMMMMVILGLIFPPVGLIAFVVSSTTKVDLVIVYRGCLALMLPVVVTLVLIMVFPEIALWLPSRMKQ